MFALLCRHRPDNRDPDVQGWEETERARIFAEALQSPLTHPAENYCWLGDKWQKQTWGNK